jgi:hypothetical protein
MEENKSALLLLCNREITYATQWQNQEELLINTPPCTFMSTFTLIFTIYKGIS